MKLYHFSEQPDIRTFVPRQLDYRRTEPAMVWTIDEFHAPHYYFPRDCPRVCIWPVEDTNEADIQRFFGQSETRRMIAIESRWFERVNRASIYRYESAPDPFSLYTADAGYYTSTSTVQPVSVERMDDLLHRLTCLGIEIRVTPSLFPLRDAILSSTVQFSMIRMKNAQ